MKRIILLALCFMLVFTLCQPVFAASNITWTGLGGDDSWHNADNWNPAQVPGLGDTAVIPETKKVVVYDTTSVTLDCSGEVSVKSGNTLWLTGTSYLKGNGKLSGDGNITIMVDNSELQWSGGSIEGNGTFTVAKNTRLVIDTVSDVGMSRPLENNGQVMLTNGDLGLMGGGTGTGTFTVSGGAYLHFEQGNYSIGGDFVNRGEMTIWPNSSVGFNADYWQEDESTLVLKVGGTGADQYCKLDVAGAATLGGILEIDFIKEYAPLPGDSFEIVTCGSRANEFSEIRNNMEDVGITLVPTYTETGLTLTVSGGAAKVWEVKDAEELENALNGFKSGDTIKLLDNITYTSPVEVDGETIYFELGNYNLLVDTSDNPDESINYILTVKNGGKVKLDGAGTGKFNITSSSSNLWEGVRVLGADSEVTVNNVDVTGEEATGVYAKDGNVVINGDITVGHRGVATAAVAGTSVTVNGNITVLGNGLAGEGIYADEKTAVYVTGDVTVEGTDYIGVHAAGGTIEVGRNVVSSGIGAKAKSRYDEGKGEVKIHGSLSAGSPFIIVGTIEKTAADIADPTTEPGFLTYSDGVNTVWIGSVGGPAEFAGGDGSEDNPYLIATADHLNNVRNHLDKHFRQTADLDLSGYSTGDGWEPIGASDDFTGNFDGGGYTISGLVINRPAQDDIGLFAYAETTAKIRNLGLVGANVTGRNYVGGLVGGNRGQLTNSYVTGDVTGESRVGGLVGQNFGSIDSSYATGTVTDTETGVNYTYVGGLVGSNIGWVSNSFARGAVSGQENIGGLVGYNSSSITNSYAIGAVSGDSYIGGLVGFNHSDGIITGSYWDTDTSLQASSDGSTWVTANTSTTHTFTGLTNGTAYFFKVRAVNSAGNGAEASVSATPTANVCKIGATEYVALDDALAALVDNSPTTITLLQNITDSDGISLSRKKLSIDLNGKTLTVNNSTGIGIEMDLFSELNITGPGILNVCGNSIGLYLNQSSFAATENVMVDITSDKGEGLGTDTGCTVSMHGNISGAQHGIGAGTRNTITVDGTVTSTGTGSGNHAVRLGGRGNTVQVGNVIVSDGTGAGIYVEDGGTITVGSQTSSASVTGRGSGIYTRQGFNTAVITVYGDVTAGGARAINANGDADIKVYGDVKSTSTLASGFAVEGFANTGDDISVSITGNVEGPNGVKYHGNNGMVSVGGNVTATCDASDTVGVYASYGSVGVTGNVASGGIGAEAGENGKITIDGVLTANTYVKVYYETKTAADKEQNTTKPGYHTYQKNSAVVWIKDGASAAAYLLTVEDGTGGGSYLPGTPVSIAANPPAQGKVFDKWTTSNGGSFANANSADTTFTMPSGAVTVTATYKDAPVATYTVTVNDSYAAVTGAGSYVEGATVTINAGSRTNYSFSGWTSPDGVTFTNANNVTTTFTMLGKDVTITANWSYDGGNGDNDSDSSDGGSSTPTTPAAPAYKADVKAGSGMETTIPVTVDKDAGTASVDAGSQGLDQGEINITIPSIPDVDTYSVGIPVPDLSTSDIQGRLTVNTDAGNITVPSNMLTGVSGISGSKAEIAIGQGDKDNLPDAVKAAIGNRPLIRLSLSIDGKQIDWSNPDAPVTVSISYTPTAAELANLESIVAWYIDGTGRAVSVPNGRYDSATGMVIFTTTHFSGYAVVYNKVSFNDVAADAWYHKAVSFIAARGITGGTGSGNYSPEVQLTRGQFIVMLMKAYDIAPDANPKNNFADAGATYYTGYLAAAKHLSISSGVGNNMFAPEKEITRQEMFTLLYNALKVIRQLPRGDSDKTINNFTDAGQIAAWAKEAITLLVKTGIVGGSNGTLTPLGTTTRAEMAQVLYNLLSK